MDVTNCQVSNWKWGIESWDDTFAVPSPYLDLHVHNCHFSENTSFGLLNHSSNKTVAICNEWGHPTGPYHPISNPNGEGNVVSDLVDFEPWFKGAETLFSNSYFLSAANGGSIDFFLDAGSDNANRNYILLGSFSGTEPGTALPGGFTTLPLNWDPLTNFILALVNSNLFTHFMGVLDGSGQGQALLNVHSIPSNYAGLAMYFAFALNKPFDIVSNPIEISITP